MINQPFFRNFFVWMLLAGILLGVVSCRGESGPIYRTWIDFPQQGSEFSSGSTIPITFHFAENKNISDVVIYVNGEVIHRESPSFTGNPVLGVSQDWIPDQPGDYRIEVAIRDELGSILHKSLVDISVLGELVPIPPDLTVTDIRLEGNDRISCDFSNLGGAVLPAGRDVWIDIILGPAESEVPPIARANVGVGDSLGFGAERIFTTAPISPVPNWPHLVTCRIDVGDLVGESEEDNNQRGENLGLDLTALQPTTETPTITSPPPTTPPAPTTQPPPTYTAQPPDTSPPNISNMSAVPDRIAALPCQQNSTTITAQVTDPSGIDQVKLYYRAAKGGISGSWQILPMTSGGGNQYQTTVGPTELNASYSPYAGLILQYYVKAWDTVGNFGQTSSGNVPLDYCVQ